MSKINQACDIPNLEVEIAFSALVLLQLEVILPSHKCYEEIGHGSYDQIYLFCPCTQTLSNRKRLQFRSAEEDVMGLRILATLQAACCSGHPFVQFPYEPHCSNL